MVTAEGLHGRVVDNSHRLAERLAKIESDPAFAQMFWLACDPTIPHRSGKTDRDGIEFPTGDGLFDLRHHSFGRHARAGIELALVVARKHQLHVRAANIDHKNLLFLSHDWPGSALIGVNLMERNFFDSANRFA